jgi:uncharacterized protein (DUF1501 family)
MSLFRDRLSRRDWLKLAALGVLGTSASGWFASLARAAESTGQRHKSCILLWMNGGPAQSHTFDLKDGSEYQPIATAVPGIQISEYLPGIAKQMPHLALLRGMSTGEASHGRARYLMHTGFRQGAGGVTHPSLGSIVSSEVGSPDAELPNYVAVGGSLGSGYLGPRHAPLNVADPAKGVENLQAFGELSDLDERAALLDGLDRDLLGRYSAEPIEAHQKGYQRAVQLMHSAKAKAFEIDQEPEKVREAYGKSKFGEGCLLARRLVEAGVSFVEVMLDGWDTHNGAAREVKPLSEQLDPAFATLITDLKDRGLLDTTLLIWMGEFGRTPGKGFNHFARAWTTVLGGAGLKTGQVIGKTDQTGGTVEERPVGAADFMATVCQALGIDPAKLYLSKSGRPFRLVDKGGQIVKELFS